MYCSATLGFVVSFLGYAAGNLGIWEKAEWYRCSGRSYARDRGRAAAWQDRHSCCDGSSGRACSRRRKDVCVKAGETIFGGERIVYFHSMNKRKDGVNWPLFLENDISQN